MNHLGELYKENDSTQPSGLNDRQMWHTPTELFNPWYGYAVANYIVQQFQKKPSPKLLIYEVGAGNGSLMINILDYIKTHYADTLYPIVEYVIIEISPQLVAKQNDLLKNGKHSGKGTVINKSVFDWDTVVDEPCFFLAMEVIVRSRKQNNCLLLLQIRIIFHTTLFDTTWIPKNHCKV